MSHYPGVYWKPVFNILEGVLEVVLVNAHHVKAVPGRKTDVRDCEWLADLLRRGLLRASFIPPPEIRELRELVRYRRTLIKEQMAVSNRVQKLVESDNIKLAQVASDALGLSGRAMLRALADGEADAAKLAGLARGRLRVKTAELQRALEGRLTPAQRFVLGELLGRYEELEAAITRASAQIAQEVARSNDTFVPEAMSLLQTIPGVSERLAETIIPEVGVEMGRFATDAHLASWAGMCPGKNESAGKRKSGKTTKGSVYLRAALVQAAWAASHTRQTYLAAQYRRLVKRMSRKKALVAVGHSLLVIIYHVLKNRASYQELGGDYFDRQHVEVQRARLIRKLETLGLKVTVEELPQAAYLPVPGIFITGCCLPGTIARCLRTRRSETTIELNERTIYMRRISLLIAIALITFGVGIAAVYFWLIGSRSTPVPTSTVVSSAPPLQPKPAGITQGRDLSLYDNGGRQGCGGVYLKTEAKRCEATVGKARDFIWRHWREKRRGYVIVKLGSVDAQSDAHLFIEPDELGDWHIAWRWERIDGMNVKPGEVDDMPDIRAVELMRATDKDYRFIAGTSYLSFMGKDGNEVSYL